MAVVLTWLIVMTLLTASSTTGVLGQGPLPGTNKALFIFGDSIYDAGNNIYEPANSHINYYPYGETYFSKPTGRVSDGRIIPDFVADYMKIPFIRPYSQPGFTNYTDGANFASSGASVLPENRPYATYLALQLKNFESVATKIENERGGKTANLLVSNAIYLISIGGNDYADLPSNTTSAARKRMVARVLATLSSALKGSKLEIVRVVGAGHSMDSSHVEARMGQSSITIAANLVSTYGSTGLIQLMWPTGNSQTCFGRGLRLMCLLSI
uniref:GDSL esterase/lipase n=1 Tax=Kalanchoe fedtschenkoi TaxID=63787 RepID=A0A7N0UL63_KALFE